MVRWWYGSCGPRAEVDVLLFDKKTNNNSIVYIIYNIVV